MTELIAGLGGGGGGGGSKIGKQATKKLGCRIGGAKSKETRNSTVTVGFDTVLQLTVPHFQIGFFIVLGLFSYRIQSNPVYLVSLLYAPHQSMYYNT